MGLILLFAMIGVPILEIAVFIEAGQRLGLWPTLGAVILTAVVGTALLRDQGLSTLGRARKSLALGQLPVVEVFDGLCLLVGGALLLTPGFVTDTLGLLLMMPPVRVLLRRWCATQLVDKGWPNARSAGRSPDGRSPRGGFNSVIDGEFEEITDEKERPGDEKGERSGNGENTSKSTRDRRV